MIRPSTTERVVLVDHRDRPIGSAEKLDAHRRSLLHRAFSVFILDDDGRLLLQRRAPGKYHSGGLWTNTCCGHPRPGEALVDAARRRLIEEMGIDVPLRQVTAFRYSAPVGEGLRERELDHVLVGRWTGSPEPDPAEADAWRWVWPHEALRDAENRPERYTAWFAPALRRLLAFGGATAAERAADLRRPAASGEVA